MANVSSDLAQPNPPLTTKLYIPPTRSDLVSRPRLTQRLSQGLECKLTLVSAPAGFGKTTLVSDWLSGLERPSTWLSLDEGDNDLARFLSYVIAALQRIDSSLGQTTQAILQTPQLPAVEPLLTPVINEIAALGTSFVLVLDDYHTIALPTIHEAVTFLLEHMPPNIHLVIATREDLTMSLARLRADRQMMEIRGGDLRFTEEEATAFLNQTMGLNLTAEDVTSLEQRTEGWIVGLQLAALSMQEVPPERIPDFIQAFAGSHRYIVDYLTEEVLRSRPPGTRSFLLRTSILDRLTGPLCDAVIGSPLLTGEGQGQGQLHLAYKTCQQGLQLAKTTEERYGQGLPATAWIQVVLADLLREWNKLDEAADHLGKCIELCRLWQVGDMLCASYLIQARVRQAQGDFAGALDSIRQAEQLPQAYRDVPWTGGPIRACRARLMLTQAVSTGDADHLEAVERWIEAHGLKSDGEIKSLSDESEYLVWVRLLIIQNESDQALKLLARLLQAAEDGGRRGRLIEILALQALAQRAPGDTQQALIPLKRALSLAEPEGYVRLFVDEGEPMANLLSQAASRGIAPVYVGNLLAAFEIGTKDRRRTTETSPSSFVVRPSSPALRRPPSEPRGEAEGLVEPLSARELDVLRLLNTDLSAPEIAAELVVSANTVRTHIKHIYSKLDAHSRYQAVERAKKLNLL